MKTTRMYKIWQIIYPVGIYYVVSSVVYFMLELMLGMAQETYMLRQMFCAAATIPFVYSFYRQDKNIADTVYGKQKIFRDGEKAACCGVLIKNILLSTAAAAALGIAVNNLIAMTPLIQVSQGFETANEAFFAGGVIGELLGSCLVIPIAEELLYRGVVYRRLKILFGAAPAIFMSAVIFGLMHFNLVQFLYAGILGVLLAYLLERIGFLYAPILGHIAANVAAVVRQETGWLAFSYEPDALGIGFTAGLLAVAGLLIWLVGRESKAES